MRTNELPLPMGDLDPHLTHDSLGPSEPITQRHLDPFSRFCRDDCRVSLYFTMGRPFPPQNCPFAWGIWTHLIRGSLDPLKSSTQTESRSVQPFFAGLTSVIDRPTDRPRYSVGNNRPQLLVCTVRSTLMRPKSHDSGVV